MFTGIIEGFGMLQSVSHRGADAVMRFGTTMSLDDTKEGDSISVSGACLTVTSLDADGFTVDVSAETLSKTTLGALRRGDRVNLERALRLTSFLGGHLVLGHVDCVGTIRERTPQSQSLVFGFDVGSRFDKYIVEKGSVTVDGISLTVNRCEKSRFYVTIIPHTAEKTTLGFKKAGDRVNIETDIIGKYVEKLVTPGGGIDMDFLADKGFL